jgi:hypothetical protein
MTADAAGPADIDLGRARPEDRVVVSTEGTDTAATMARDLVRLGVPRSSVRVDHVEDLAVVGRGKQRDEAATSSMTPGMAIGNAEQVVSGWTFSIVGFVLGFAGAALVGAFIPIGDLPWVATAALVGLCGGLAGAAAGLVWGLSRGPELAGEGRDTPATSVLSVRAGDIAARPEARRLLTNAPTVAFWVAGAAPDPAVGAPRRQGTAAHPDPTGRPVDR